MASTLASRPLDELSQRRIDRLQQQLAPYRQQLIEHRVYREISSLDRLRAFMEHHVFAVWDFMSLLKFLQSELTCTNVPWRPQGDPLSRRLINEIVLAEESDVVDDGFASHFEMYLAAMNDSGAQVSPILGFIEQIRSGTPVAAALASDPQIPAAAKEFVTATFTILATNSPHGVAAAFALGREDLIPDMFQAMVRDIGQRFPGKLSRFMTYLDRHIALDGEEHTPLALRMLASLCADDDTRWEEATAAAVSSLQARRALWDGVVACFNR